MNKAFFLDRDGTLNVDYDYVHLQSQWTWCDRAVESIQWMNKNGWLVIVVTNQSGVARGKYGLSHIQELHQWVDAELANYDAHVDKWYVAPFHPSYHNGLDPSLLDYRKPGTGMFELARREFDIDFRQSVMVGDKISDLEPSLKLGMKSFFVRSVHEATQDKTWLDTHQIPICDNLGNVIDQFKIEENWNNVTETDYK